MFYMYNTIVSLFLLVAVVLRVGTVAGALSKRHGRQLSQFDNDAVRRSEQGIEGDQDDSVDYISENTWLQGSDFEGLFEEEEAGGKESTRQRAIPFAQSDYDEEVSHDVNIDAIIDHYEESMEGKTHEEGNGAEHAVDRAPDRRQAPAVPRKGGHRKSGDGAVPNSNSKAHALPSFEETPMPEKPTFAEWRRQKRQEHLRKQSPPMDLTSSLYLVPESVGYNGGESYVAACLVVRDEHDYIVEWVNHHLSLDIHPIYIYDHKSLPPLDEFLRQYIVDGRVVYERMDQKGQIDGLSPQLYAYEKCLRDHGPAHHWLLFLDVDEFLIFRSPHPIQSLPAFLAEFEKYSALAVHWILFGSSGHDTKPLRSVLRSYIRCLPLKHTHHLFVKSIVNTRCTVGTSDSPHSFRYNCSNPAVRTDTSPIEGATASDFPVHDRLVIHHYATKSVEDFELKILKGSGMRRQRGWEYFYFVDGWSTEFNFDGLKIWNSDVVTKTRALDPEILRSQLAGYSEEALENFWGTDTMRKEDFLEYLEAYDPDTREEEELSEDADEGEW